jgi:hypothetical protein
MTGCVLKLIKIRQATKSSLTMFESWCIIQTTKQGIQMKVRVMSKNRAAQRRHHVAIVFRTVVAELLPLPSDLASVMSGLLPDKSAQEIWRASTKSTAI